HTRSKRDWSSDVCSSDLTFVLGVALQAVGPFALPVNPGVAGSLAHIENPRIVVANDRVAVCVHGCAPDVGADAELPNLRTCRRRRWRDGIWSERGVSTPHRGIRVLHPGAVRCRSVTECRDRAARRTVGALAHN